MRVLGIEPPICGIVVPCTQIVGLRLSVKVLAAIEERVVALADLRSQVAEGIIGIACDNGVVLDQLHHIAVGIVDVNLTLAVVRTIQPVEVCNAIRNAFAVLVHNVHAIVDEILCAAADRLYVAKTVWIICISCAHIGSVEVRLLIACIVSISSDYNW